MPTPIGVSGFSSRLWEPGSAHLPEFFPCHRINSIFNEDPTISTDLTGEETKVCDHRVLVYDIAFSSTFKPFILFSSISQLTDEQLSSK